MMSLIKTLRATFWLCFSGSLGGWWYALGIDSRREWVAEVLHWLGMIQW